ncbi:MAG: hypothetical protein WDA16_02925 [Candidatus Thermoplasmatota archaeon]
MERSSLHVAARTRRRLARYKAHGMSFDDVLNVFMDGIEGDEFKARWEEARREAARAAIRAPRRAVARGGSGMETAFRLFKLGRIDS